MYSSLAQIACLKKKSWIFHATLVESVQKGSFNIEEKEFVVLQK